MAMATCFRAFVPRGCPSCGGDALVFVIRTGQFLPIVGKCFSCTHAWPILRGTHAHKELQVLDEFKEAEAEISK